jgi:hypothetical protein
MTISKISLRPSAINPYYIKPVGNISPSQNNTQKDPTQVASRKGFTSYSPEGESLQEPLVSGAYIDIQA